MFPLYSSAVPLSTPKVKPMLKIHLIKILTIIAFACSQPSYWTTRLSEVIASMIPYPSDCSLWSPPAAENLTHRFSIRVCQSALVDLKVFVVKVRLGLQVKPWVKFNLPTALSTTWFKLRPLGFTCPSSFAILESTDLSMLLVDQLTTLVIGIALVASSGILLSSQWSGAYCFAGMIL
jgi:hypothetical protein